MSQIKTLPLSQIRIDGGTQPRLEIDESVVADYAEQMESGDQFTPAIVFFDGTNNWLADGFHRFHAANKAMLEELLCDVRQGTRRDAVLYSVGANAKHGLRRSVADKRRAVETLLKDEEWRQFGPTGIAERTNVSRQFVYQVMNDKPHLSTLTNENTKYVDKYGTTTTKNIVNVGPKDPIQLSKVHVYRSIWKSLEPHVEIGQRLRDAKASLNDEQLFHFWVEQALPMLEFIQIAEYIKLAEMAETPGIEDAALVQQMHKAMLIDDGNAGMMAVA